MRTCNDNGAGPALERGRAATSSRGPARWSLASILLLATAGCALLGGDAADRWQRTLELDSALVAAVCAHVVRCVHPSADDRPYVAGAVAVDLGGGSYRIEVVEEFDGSRRFVGNCRLRVHRAEDAADELALRVEEEAMPRRGSRVAARGRCVVRVDRGSADGAARQATVEVLATGTLRTTDLSHRLAVTLSAVDAIQRSRRQLAAGAATEARATMERCVAGLQTARDPLEPFWSAQAFLALAAAQQADDPGADARQALARAVAFAPDLQRARRRLADFARSHALPAAADAHDRTLASDLGVGFAALCRQEHVRAAQLLARDEAGPWLVAAATCLDSGDLAAARRHAVRARGRGADTDAAALALLSVIAERQGDDRLAREFRLAQALASGFSPELRVALSRIAQRQGQPESAVRWLGEAWGELQHVAAARALLRDVLAGMDADASARLLAPAPALKAAMVSTAAGEVAPAAGTPATPPRE